MKHALLISLGLLAVAVAAPSVHAQDTMPPASELQMPASGLPMPAQATDVRAAAAQTTSNNTSSKDQADTATGMPNDPCPNLRGASANAPDDLSKVQQDIDRFTLCVQRAQLLERLNENAIRSIENTDKALGLSAPNVDAMAANMPPLPADALAGANVEPLPVTDAPATATTATPAAAPAA